MTYIFLGDSPLLKTGFATITKNIVPQLDLPNKHFWAIGYNGEPHNFNFNLYPANINSAWETKENANKFKNFALSFEDDLTIWTIHDAFRLSKFAEDISELKEQRNVKLVSYIPVDSPLTLAHNKPFLDLVDVIVAYTEFGKKELQKITDKKILIIPHGNDEDFQKRETLKERFFPSLGDKKLIGVVNTNTERKNLLRSLEILEKILEQDENWMMYFHCDAEGFCDLKRAAYQMGILQNCIFADPFFQSNIIGAAGASKEDLISLYNCFDFYLSTSLGEGWGLTATEAASCEVPVILPKNSAFQDIFDEESCLFLPRGHTKMYLNNLIYDVDAEASANLILEKESGLIKRAKIAKRKVEKFKWTEINKKWQILIE